MCKHCRVLLAFLGIVVIQGLLLSEAFFRGRLDLRFETRLRGVSVNPFDIPGHITDFQDELYVTCLALALFAWSWTGSFVLGYLSRQVAWITWFLFYLVVLDSYWTRLVIKGNIQIGDDIPMWLITLDSLLPYHKLELLLLFVPAGIWALSESSRSDNLRRLPLLIASGALVLSSLLYWMSAWYDSNGAPPGPSKVWVILLLTCPAVYIIAAAVQESREK